MERNGKENKQWKRFGKCETGDRLIGAGVTTELANTIIIKSAFCPFIHPHFVKLFLNTFSDRRINKYV